MLQWLSEWWPSGIFILSVGNFVLWVYLIISCRRFKAKLNSYLFSLVRPLSRQTDPDPTVSDDERIDAFIADIGEVIQNPRDQGEGRDLYDRITTKDESRIYLKNHPFDIWYSIACALIEIYPLLGIVGTVLGVWAGFSETGTADPEKINRIVQNFSESVKSTAMGLIAAICFMLLNSGFEPSFTRRMAYGARILELVSHAKKQLGMLPPTRTEEPV